MMTTESQEIADLFRNPRRWSQPLNTVTSHTYGTSATGEADPGGDGETGHPAHRLGARGSFTSRVVPSDDSMTPDDYLGASVGSGGGSYDPYGGGGYTSPFESLYGGPTSYDGRPDPYGGGGSYGDYDPYEGGMSGSPEPERYEDGMSGSPAPWYTDRGLPIYEYDPYSGGGYDPYDPYAAEDARLASLAAGMPDSTAPSFGSSGVSSAPTSSPSDYYSSPEWLRMLASIQGGLASGSI